MDTANTLKQAKGLLRSYTLSESSLQILKKAPLTLLAAPTSSGRNSIIKKLLETDKYHFVVSDTTRKPRVNNGIPEQNGVEYWFRSHQEVVEDLRSGKYLEAAIVHETDIYGISIRELKKALDSKKIPITDIEIVGVDSVLKLKPDTTAVFVVPPHFEEWHDRLEKRGEMSRDELERRMRSAAEELKHALENESSYHFLVNDSLEHAVEQMHQIVFEDNHDPLHQSTAKRTIEQLLVDTEKFLNS